MANYTGWQYLLIDAANQFGLDKLLFEERIEWATAILPTLEMMTVHADNKPMFIKAVMAIRKAQAKIPTGHMVGLDACCSGIQIMSALTGCIAGATATGLVNPDVRADAYTHTTSVMNDILGGTLNVSRADAKQSLMTAFYGSKEVPKQVFGEDTPELNAFYAAANTVAPGAWELLQDLLASWQPYALEHSWKLPDGFDAKVKVMTKIDSADSRSRIEVDELNHATFTYEYYVNEGKKEGLSNAANLTHSVDAYVLRAMHRRCNYDVSVVEQALENIQFDLQTSKGNRQPWARTLASSKVAYYCDQYDRSTLADAVILPYLTADQTTYLSTAHLQKLEAICLGMLSYKPFELVTVHDEFKAHANNLNHVRYQYKEILAEIAESNVLGDLLSQINKQQGTFNKLSNNLGDLIRGSAYALS